MGQNILETFYEVLFLYSNSGPVLSVPKKVWDIVMVKHSSTLSVFSNY